MTLREAQNRKRLILNNHPKSLEGRTVENDIVPGDLAWCAWKYCDLRTHPTSYLVTTTTTAHKAGTAQRIAA